MIARRIHFLAEAGAEWGLKVAGAEIVGPCGIQGGKEGENRWELIEDYQPFSIAES